MFTKSVAWYDAVYNWKNYEREAQRLRLLMDQHAQSTITTLLDVACGTGQHITHLKPHYTVEGLDLDPEMLSLARRRHPDVAFHQGDMRTFDLGRRFDAVICLFSSIAYCRSTTELAQTVGCMAKHANPSGLVIVEPFFAPRAVRAGTPRGDLRGPSGSQDRPHPHVVPLRAGRRDAVPLPRRHRGRRRTLH